VCPLHPALRNVLNSFLIVVWCPFHIKSAFHRGSHLLFYLCQIRSHVRILIIIGYYTLSYSYNFNPILKTIWLWSSSVIKIVKMKYNRINIKWWLVSTSFKIYLDILSNLYITFTIFYYNTISLKCTFVFLFWLKDFIKHNHTVYM
jgi:hypothetical protein